MIRRLGILAILVVAVSVFTRCVQQRSAPRPPRPSPPASVDEATRLNTCTEQLYAEGKVREAIPLAERSLALREAALGPQHPDVAEALSNLGLFYTAQGAFAKAEPRFIRALEIYEKGLGTMHPSVAITLNLVPFEALVDPQGHYELEQRLASYVTSGRDLLRLATRRPPRSSATIVAAPDYGPPPSPALHGQGTFRPLEGATAELAELPAYFAQVRTLTGSQATKAALAATVGPVVLHIATHGFYTPNAAATATSSTKSTDSASCASTPPASSTPPGVQRGMHLDGDAFSPLSPPPEDPTDALDHAGLAMTGANVSPDGIASARELASYDWWGTQLVVLSACETGVGDVPSGEGVYGMRRALVLAGAESQIVSLWSVNDASTRALMRAFYGELAHGTGRAEALRRAKLRLLQQPKFAHPYYWAAFIPAGDWTPLDPHLLKPREHGR